MKSWSSSTHDLLIGWEAMLSCQKSKSLTDTTWPIILNLWAWILRKCAIMRSIAPLNLPGLTCVKRKCGDPEVRFAATPCFLRANPLFDCAREASMCRFRFSFSAPFIFLRERSHFWMCPFSRLRQTYNMKHDDLQRFALAPRWVRLDRTSLFPSAEKVQIFSRIVGDLFSLRL